MARRKRRTNPREMERVIELLGSALESAWVGDRSSRSVAIEWGLRAYRNYKRFGDSGRRGPPFHLPCGMTLSDRPSPKVSDAARELMRKQDEAKAR